MHILLHCIVYAMLQYCFFQWQIECSLTVRPHSGLRDDSCATESYISIRDC